MLLRITLFYLAGEEFFKVKKPSFNEVTFRIKKKESLLSAQTETEETTSKYFFLVKCFMKYMKNDVKICC